MNPRRWTILLWSSVVLGCAAAAWLFLPRRLDGAGTGPELRVVLVDASASVSRASEWLPWVRGELALAARATREAKAELAVVSFADGVASGFGPGDPTRFLEALEGRNGRPFDPGAGLGRGATRMADALRAATPLLLASRRPKGELCLLGPGTYTGDAPTAELARLADAGVALELRAPPVPAAADLGLGELVLAPRVEAGAPLIALARLHWRPGSLPAPPARLELEIECDGSRRTRTRELLLPVEGGAFELPVDCGPAGFGRNEVRARCFLSDGPDLLPENDQARSSALADGARTFGVLVRAEQRVAAEAWLAPAQRSALAGLQFLFLPPEELSRRLSGLAAVISFDLAPGELSQPLLESFVQRGGGWLALSGYHFLDEWIPGEEGGALHRLLPCEPAPIEAAPRDVVLLIDGSGSMEGEPFETVRAAALELVAAALPSDRVSLRFFTTRLELEHVLKERTATRAEDQDAARRAARELLALRVPSGTTYLLSSLHELAAGAGEHETLALLLTDGWEREPLPDPIGLAQHLTLELAAANARLVVVAVGDANERLLGTLAGGVDRIRSGRTLADLRDVFHAELHGPQLAQGAFTPRLAPRAPGSLADEVSAGSAGAAPLPMLARYVRNRLRPGAEALWSSEEREPILALARAGLGRVALFASLPGPGWAPAYARPGLGEPAEFEGLLRWLARGPERAPDPRARLADGRLSVQGLAGDSPAVFPVELLDLASGQGAAPGRELRLLPPAGMGADVLRTRVAPLSGSAPLDPILVFGPSPGVVLPVELALPPEFAWSERAVPAELWSRPREVSAGASGEAGRSRAAAPWVIAGALAGFLAAGLATAKGQGVRPFGR